MNRIARAWLVCLLAALLPVAGIAEAWEDAAMPESLAEVDIVGLWRLEAVKIKGMLLDPAMMGMEMTIDFRADHAVCGSFSQNMGDSGQAEETWSLDAERCLICVSESPYLKVRHADGRLFLIMDEEITDQATGDLVFTRVVE